MTKSFEERRDETIAAAQRAVAQQREHQLLELGHRFTYHAPKGDQVERYQKIRRTALEFAELIVELCPLSREQSVAFTRLEEVVMFANAAIAREVELEDEAEAEAEVLTEVGAEDITDPGSGER